MKYLVLPQNQQEPNTHLKLMYRDNQFWFQVIKQVKKKKLEFTNVPLNTIALINVVNKAINLEQNGRYASDDSRSNATLPADERYIVDMSNPPSMNNLPEEEIFIDIWEQDDGLAIIIIIGEDNNEVIRCFIDDLTLEKVQNFIRNMCEDMIKQMMPIKGHEMDTGDYVNQFGCCDNCDICHCAP